jgi:transcription termination factor Rho
MDYSQYNRDTLQELPLYELRIIGRTVGVKSPTSMNKSDLLKAICDIAFNSQNSGDAAPKARTTGRKQGRPPKGKAIIFSDSGAMPSQPVVPVIADKIVSVQEPVDKLSILNGITAPVGKAFTKSAAAPQRPQFRSFEKKPFNRYQNNGQNAQQTQNRQQYSNQNDSGTAVSSDSQTQDNAEAAVEDVLETKEGVLEIMPDGYGFLRAHNYDGSDKDAYVSAQKIKRSGLRKGDWVKAEAKKTCENRPAGVVNVLSVNGREPDKAFCRKNFDTLTPIYPDKRFRLEIEGVNNDLAIRSIDLVAPIGKGQRAMIVSPPKAGKTTVLKKIANSISVNYPAVHLIVLLIDERPEEVTDMQRSIKGEVVYSTFDEMPEHHTKAAELVLERAKRLVELGDDVVILMDSLTRLARAYNLTIAPTGRTLSGGIDPGALHSPKRFFGAARNIENGGSLTIVATALIDTGSRMDDVIYEEFKGTGNMEIHLDRKLTEKRIFPAIDLNRSGTRREELLLSQKELEIAWGMRRMLNAGDGGDATEILISEMLKTKTNREFMDSIDKKIRYMQQQGFLKN